MECKHKQICNVCDAPFKMERGCGLEKRCPACRFLGMQKGNRLKTNMDCMPTGEGLFMLYFPEEKNHKARIGINRYGVEFLEYSDELDYGWYLEPNNDYENISDMHDGIMQAVSVLTNREKEVVLLYYELAYMKNTEDTFASIARALSLTNERIRQIHSRAIYKLKHPKIARKYLKQQWEEIRENRRRR